MHRSIHSQFPSIGIERITSVIETRKFDEILEIAVGASSPCLILVIHIQTVKMDDIRYIHPRVHRCWDQSLGQAGLMVLMSFMLRENLLRN